MPRPGGPRGGHHGGPMGGPRHGFGGPPPHRGWHGGPGYRPGCGGCLFSFLFIIGLGAAGVVGITSLIL